LNFGNLGSRCRGQSSAGNHAADPFKQHGMKKNEALGKSREKTIKMEVVKAFIERVLEKKPKKSMVWGRREGGPCDKSGGSSPLTEEISLQAWLCARSSEWRMGGLINREHERRADMD